eukprot:c17067_g1_i3.p1 GENE.c17067_g1_i3~~c17067_g1_i3.p1  ORF type:complete len:206 (+),score=32.33 c17067_g1_i3:75-692(+)
MRLCRLARMKSWMLQLMTKMMTYVDSLYGHQSEVTCIDALSKERAVTGGRDSTVRWWKIPEESQLLFKAHTGSVDAVAMLTGDRAFSGSQDGSLALWDVLKKKPIWSQVSHASKWITSVASLRGTDVCASGSWDGTIRLWKFDNEGRRMELVNTVPLSGFVNSMAFARSRKFLLAGVGQEHKFGRWERVAGARNGVHLISLPLES